MSFPCGVCGIPSQGPELGTLASPISPQNEDAAVWIEHFHVTIAEDSDLHGVTGFCRQGPSNRRVGPSQLAPKSAKSSLRRGGTLRRSARFRARILILPLLPRVEVIAPPGAVDNVDFSYVLPPEHPAVFKRLVCSTGAHDNWRGGWPWPRTAIVLLWTRLVGAGIADRTYPILINIPLTGVVVVGTIILTVQYTITVGISRRCGGRALDATPTRANTWAMIHLTRPARGRCTHDRHRRCGGAGRPCEVSEDDLAAAGHPHTRG